jgi:hypothetical protein
VKVLHTNCAFVDRVGHLFSAKDVTDSHRVLMFTSCKHHVIDNQSKFVFTVPSKSGECGSPQMSHCSKLGGAH